VRAVHWRRLRSGLVIGLLSLGVLTGGSVAAAGNGGWQIVPAPTVPGGSDQRLASVSCVSDTDCWAVGYYFGSTGDYETLTEHFDGTSWAVVPSPDQRTSAVTNSRQDNYLTGVSCLPDGACWAVGYWYDGTNNAQPLVETHSAGSWSIVASPSTASVVSDYLTAVSCAGPSDCWAVGYTLVPGYSTGFLAVPGTAPQTFTEHYDGTSWSIVNAQNNSSSENAFYGISCAGGSSCWAVGVYSTGSRYEPLTEQESGGSWTAVASPAVPGRTETTLDSVSCVAAGCFASGLSSGSGIPDQNLMEAESGGGWAIVPTPDVNSQRLNSLTAVACISVEDCWATGSYDATGNFDFQTLILHGGASGWSVVPSPDTDPAAANYLQGLACPDAAHCWAVGFYQGPHGNEPLIEEYLAGGPAPTVPDLGLPAVAVGLVLAVVAAWVPAIGRFRR
jgi:hypothetical protein